MRIGIIDYGVGNLRSVEKAFETSGCNGSVVISGDERVLREVDSLVLPGVGAFGACMKALKERGFDELILDRVSMGGVPILGICVGMQMLFEGSEEFGWNEGLGFLKGTVKRFPENLRVPHVGWNAVKIKNKHWLHKEVEYTHPLLDGIKDNSYFYFVHSYYCKATYENYVVGETEYGLSFNSIATKGRICGVQFHPEKSQANGLKLLRNFAEKVFMPRNPNGLDIFCASCETTLAKYDAATDEYNPGDEELFEKGKVPIPNFGWFCNQHCADVGEMKYGVSFDRDETGKVSYE